MCLDPQHCSYHILSGLGALCSALLYAAGGLSTQQVGENNRGLGFDSTKVLINKSYEYGTVCDTLVLHAHFSKIRIMLGFVWQLAWNLQTIDRYVFRRGKVC